MDEMSAEVLDVDPVTAALRLLGAVISAAGVSARIVEVEAYGGPREAPGRTRPRIRTGENGTQCRHVRPTRAALHLPQLWNSCVRQHFLRIRRNGGGCAAPRGRHPVRRR